MFIETPRFPETISQEAESIINYSTTRVRAFSGREQKNINWQYPLHKYDVAFGIRSMSDLEEVIRFFHVCQGAAHSFRFKDWADYKSCGVLDTPSALDQTVLVGDGTTNFFQIVKNYQVGTHTKSRKITKIVPGTLLVAVNGTPTVNYTVNDLGSVVLGVTPSAGQIVTVGYEFDVPCSFDSDMMSTQLNNYDKGDIALTITEVRL